LPGGIAARIGIKSKTPGLGPGGKMPPSTAGKMPAATAQRGDSVSDVPQRKAA
jgi:hypothetical protein